ncbi:MAG: UDP-N-acetylmuramate dehydrogenase [Candidatus Hydrogenedentota bacterium]
MKTLPFDYAYADYPLAPATLYNVGGPARVALVPRTAEECREAYDWMRTQPGRKLVLGGGSNVLIDDAGFDGIVLFTTRLTRIDPLGSDRYYVEAGALLDDLVVGVMVANNYAGVGALTGIPGSVGGAIYMNAGTVNGAIGAFMAAVELLTPAGPKTVPMAPERYRYRGQDFCRPGDVILAGTFAFARAQDDQQATYDHYKQRRLEKQPQGSCCGSVFKNPEGEHAGRLIEACGLKGAREGGAVISPMHANFIMNEDGASFSDIVALIERAKDAVRTQHGIDLEEEVRIIR